MPLLDPVTLPVRLTVAFDRLVVEDGPLDRLSGRRRTAIGAR